MKVPGKKVSILGLGQSGFQSALFLHAKGYRVYASDISGQDPIRDKVEELKKLGIEADCGKHSEEEILRSNWVLLSPGINPSVPICQKIIQKGIPIFSEIEVAGWFSKSRRIIAVTGTAGKTTVSTLIAKVLRNSVREVVLCGNIGNPWVGELEKIREETYVVIEVSSFQLKFCESFHPRLAVLTNLSPNHFDWHSGMKDYVSSKLRIYQNQDSDDFALLRRQDQEQYFPDYPIQAQREYFGDDPKRNPNDDVVTRVCRLLGCSPAVIERTLREFKGIEHRLEWVGEWQGVRYVNDSKSTTSRSLAWALEKFEDQRVLLIAGGKAKAKDFADLNGLMRQKVKKAFLIGEAQALMEETWGAVCAVERCESLKEAVRKTHEEAAEGDIVLLSPACASFDMFTNYEERGMIYKKIVHEIAGGVKADV
ncbi:MAG: UDP-N-acetylmuramoyl-L-alanine--D-glutamate ligase [Candidatus Omnitrophica bacterium]|nr:UDP-N-acetylmuramoyl-L-alanine--D-glutamate ligase [Candidatus Omnitrophota bacterium]